MIRVLIDYLFDQRAYDVLTLHHSPPSMAAEIAALASTMPDVLHSVVTYEDGKEVTYVDGVTAELIFKPTTLPMEPPF